MGGLLQGITGVPFNFIKKGPGFTIGDGERGRHVIFSSNENCRCLLIIQGTTIPLGRIISIVKQDSQYLVEHINNPDNFVTTTLIENAGGVDIYFNGYATIYLINFNGADFTMIRPAV